jgi:hypothetical protein
LKKVERILIALSVISLTLVLASVDGGALLSMISLMLLSIFYWAFSFALLNNIGFRKIFATSSYQGISARHIIGAILTGFSLSTLLVGLLYKVLGWNGANNILFAGLAPGLIILIIAAIKYSRNKSMFYKELLWRMGSIGAAGLLAVFIES